MSKVLVKMSLDMNDADYVYGIHAMDKEVWEKWKKLYTEAKEIYYFAHDDERDFTPEKFLSFISVKEITDEQYQMLNDLNLIGFGRQLPTVYCEKFDDTLEPESYNNYRITVWEDDQLVDKTDEI